MKKALRIVVESGLFALQENHFPNDNTASVRFMLNDAYDCDWSIRFKLHKDDCKLIGQFFIDLASELK